MNNKAVNKFNRIFYPSIIIMIVSLFLLTGTTYAWFSSESQSLNNSISSGSLNLSIGHNSSNVELSQKQNVSKWVLETKEFEVETNDIITIENNGSLNAVVVIDYVDTSIQDIVINLKSLKDYSLTIVDSGNISIYCQSEYSYNLTI